MTTNSPRKVLSIYGQSDQHDHEHGEGQGACAVGMHVTPASAGQSIPIQQFQGRAAIVTLGCAKNHVDSEVMLGVLQQNGFEITPEVNRADVVVVNTCGFLQSAVKESVDSILEVAEHKKSGQVRRLIVAGCLVERYRSELQQSLPEVDEFLLNDELTKVGSAARAGLDRVLSDSARPYFLYDETVPRALATPKHFAYVKVSEGCNRPCTFCIIPKIRGEMRSRSIDSVVAEVNDLSARGVKEVNLVAQDLTSFGTDTKSPGLGALIEALDQRTSIDWVRLLYAYPIGVDERLLKSIVQAKRVCNYLDIPLQHSSEGLLRSMQRPVGRYSPRSIVEFIRKTAPEIAIRTTFIVGFPGETENDVADLEAFIREGHFTNLGIFTYSREPGTPSHDMDGQIPEREKQSRRKHLMKVQQAVVGKRLRSMIGSRVDVLVEGPHEETELLIKARTWFQAPEVDGCVMINDVADDLPAPHAGHLGSVEITEVAGYDLVGRLIS